MAVVWRGGEKGTLWYWERRLVASFGLEAMGIFGLLVYLYRHM
jgi:hypothetical protein